MSSRSDTDLARAAAGDGEAFRALIAPHLRTLRMLCRRLAPTEDDAQDLLQETLLAAFLGLSRLRKPERLGAWLHTIAARQALRMRRGAARRALPLMAADGLASPEDVELRVGVRDALSALPPGQRQVVLGRWVAGYRPRELAAALGVPESTVRGRAFQARRRLRVALGAGATTTKEEPRMTSADDVVLVFEDLRFGRNIGELPPPLRRFAAFRAVGERADVRLMVPVADEDAAAIEDAGGELLDELLRFGGVELEQATLEPLAAGAWSGAVHLRRGDQRRRVATRPGEAIAAALRLERPLRIKRADWLAERFDPQDAETQRERHRAARRELEARVAARPRPPAGPAVQLTLRLDPAQRAAVDAALDAAREGLRADLALLMHAAAGLIAWRGNGDRELGERYARARATGDADLADLLMGELFPSEETRGGVMFAEVARHWRLEVGLVGDFAIEHPDTAEQILRETERRLSDALA